MAAIDPDNFFDENGDIRRRDNIVAELAEGDLLIDFDRQLYKIEDGEMTIYMSGKRVGEGVPTLISAEEAYDYMSFPYRSSHSLFDIGDLGLNVDELI